ncbi:MAG: hypothetical protein PUE32_01620 [Clostridia bacterium]|nr:hypothetical protein [Clostridia bacterium]
MKLVLPYFIILLAIFQFFLRKNTKKHEELNKDFWKREREANTVRRKDISSLSYITIPDSLPMSDCNDTVIKALNKFYAFKGTKMLNLTGKSNTDLKTAYGAANLDALSEYDDNCTQMLKSIIPLATELNKSGLTDEAAAYLEFGISCRTDITQNYTMLAEYYASNGNKDKIQHLVNVAESLDSLTKKPIISKLDSILLSLDS